MKTLNQDEIYFFRNSGYLKLRWRFEEVFMDRIISILDKEIKNDVKPYKTDIN